jgi:heme exporter protein B
MLLTPTPRSAIYLGKAFSIFLFLVLVEVVLTPLVAVLFHIDLVPVLGRVTLLLAMGTLGFVAAGTLFAVMGVRTRARDLMLSVVVFPLVAPALLAGVVATREVLAGAPMEQTVGWFRILGAFDIVFVSAGIVLFEPLTTD